MSSSKTWPRYRADQSYAWNYNHAPVAAPRVEIPEMTGDWSFAGRSIASPLGVAAGPLLNGAWCRYYAALGFDILTYKTVRSGERACYPSPNLAPVSCGQLTGEERLVEQAPEMDDSWAVSFGMPSQSPESWSRDFRATREAMPPEKVLVVSVVGTVQPGWGVEQLAEDYAECAATAAAAGADAVEANLSCPNVSTVDGSLYRDPASTATVAQALRAAIGQTPLILKIGRLANRDEAAALVDAAAPARRHA